MADIELVIRIDEKLYNDICFDTEMMIYGCRYNGKTLLDSILRAIRNGTPLPKGHGRLIDADVLDDVIMQMNENGSQITRYEYKVLDNVLFEMPTIIEADKAESEEE